MTTKTIHFLPALVLPALALALGAALGGKGNQQVELDEAEVFIEFNHTDGDFGIQFFWDGDAWERMSIRDAQGKLALNVRASGDLKAQGLAEAFFESDEPPLSELSMEEFFERFPEGEYTFDGRTLEGDHLVGEAEFTHTLPAPPQNLFPGDGDVIDPNLPLVASFDAVTEDLNGDPLEPELYEVVIESENAILRVTSIILEGDVAFPTFTVPPEFLQGGAEYKLEVIVQEEGGNRTISETEFTTL